jgi:calcium permeable stress-gated cation channel
MDYPHHNTGALWIMITRRIIVGMVFYQIAMIGLLSLRKAWILSTLILPLPILTVFLLQYNIDKSFGPLMNFIALRSLRERRRRLSQSVDEERESGSLYINPNLINALDPVWTPTRTFPVLGGMDHEEGYEAEGEYEGDDY